MRLLTAGFCSLELLLVAGCGEAPRSAPRAQAFPVKGRLYFGNVVGANARIAFHPIDPVKSQGRVPVAMTLADGTFELTTYGSNDGAPEGDYSVTVTWPDSTIPFDECECTDPWQHDQLGGTFANPARTPLAATILPQSNEVNLVAEVDLPDLRRKRAAMTKLANSVTHAPKQRPTKR